MAGEWLKLEANTPEKPEVFSITVSMGWEDPDLTVGKLFKVWRWFDQQTVDGNACNVTLALLDRISGVSGFAQAMCDSGWLVKESGGLLLPNFDRHNGKTAKDRALTAKRVAKHKGNAATNANSVSSIVTQPLAREEKSREEKSREESKATAAPLASEPPPESPDQAVRLAVALRQQGITANSVHPAIQSWASDGFTVELVLEAVAVARVKKPTGNIPANYLDPIVRDLANPPASRAAQDRPAGPKFNPNNQDRSGDQRAMEESMKRHGIKPPAENEEIEL